MTDDRIAELLDGLTPRYDDRRGDWQRVAAAVRPERRVPAWLVRLGLVTAAVAVGGALVLAWPSHQREGGILDRAAAAVGDGPVLHVVLRGEWGGTLVDLGTGKRSPVYGDDEYWYDTERGRLHQLGRLGDAVQSETLYQRTRRPPDELAALVRDYRQALETGTARVGGDSTIDGEPVAWVTIHSELLPDVADGKDHAWVQQVAVSQRTFKPVALRATRDGKPAPSTLQRVIDLQFLPEGAGDFTASPERSLHGTVAAIEGRKPIALEQARATLGRTPLWLGREYERLPFAQVYRETNRIGHRRPGTSKRRFVWRVTQTNVVFFYGTVGDDPTTYRKDSVPLFNRPHVTITESTQTTPVSRGAGTYVPPAGTVFIAAGAQTGVVHVDGVQVTIDTAGENAILAAARALEAMP